MRVWERGVGETQACGTGACAAAAALHHWGRVGAEVTVHQPGAGAGRPGRRAGGRHGGRRSGRADRWRHLSGPSDGSACATWRGRSGTVVARDVSLIERSFREKIVLVGVTVPPEAEEETERHLDELALLVDTAGADEAARVVQRRDHPDPATYVGKGKAEELRDLSKAVDADTVVFDDELTPAQSRNLEKILGRTAIDRTAVILDIFAQNARTQEGKAQVELAQLRYRLPRLRGRGLALSQQAGGIGTRGPGETQLEVDRRRLVRRMTKLEGELKRLTEQRRLQRKGRRPQPAGHGLAGRLHQRRQVHPAQPADRRRRPGRGPPLRHPRPPHPAPGPCRAASRCCCPTPWASSASCPTSWSRPSARPSRWCTESDLLVHVVDSASPDPKPRSTRCARCWPRSAPTQCPSCWPSTRPTFARGQAPGRPLPGLGRASPP